MYKTGFLLPVMLIISVTPLFSQSFLFERARNPFDFKKATGTDYKMPFIGGYNAPSFQFVDIDKDNDYDLFIQEVNNRIIYFENKGTPEVFDFYWKTDDWLGKSHGAWFRFVDIDNDNDPDLFSQGQNEMIRFWVNKDNIFSVLADTLFSLDSNIIYSELSSIPHFFDIDCNGSKDLFLGRQNGTITFYKNTMNTIDQLPAFDFVTDSYQDILIIGSSFKNDLKHHGANSLAFGDLNGDGVAELLYGDFFSRSLYYFANTGTCEETLLKLASDSFPSTNPLLTSGFNFPGLIDIDSDGDLDLFSAVLGGAFSTPQNIAENFFYFQNLGEAEQAQFFQISGSFIDQFDAGSQSIPAFVDIDDDGDQDLFIGNLTIPEKESDKGQLMYFENIGDAQSPAFQLMDENFVTVDNMYNFAPAFADLDNDMDFDLLLGREFGRLVYFRNDGDKRQADFTLITTNFEGIDVGNLSVPAFADIDNDNDFDLLIGEFDGNINLYENSGNADSAVFVLKDENFAGIYSSGYAKPALFDFDNDDDPDLILGSENGEISFYRNESNSDSLIFKEINDSKEKALAVSAPTMVDIDNDGDGDLFCGTLGGGLVFFENKVISSVKDISINTYPKDYYLLQNYPNPFNSETIIEYYLKKSSRIVLTVYDLAGRKISTLSAGKKSYGWHSVAFNTTELASGIYFYRLQAGEIVLQKKMILIK